MTKKGIVFVPPKSARGRRNITLTARTVEALTQHNTIQEKEGQRLGNLWEDPWSSLTNLASSCTPGY